MVFLKHRYLGIPIFFLQADYRYPCRNSPASRIFKQQRIILVSLATSLTGYLSSSCNNSRTSHIQHSRFLCFQVFNRSQPITYFRSHTQPLALPFDFFIYSRITHPKALAYSKCSCYSSVIWIALSGICTPHQAHYSFDLSSTLSRHSIIFRKVFQTSYIVKHRHLVIVVFLSQISDYSQAVPKQPTSILQSNK
ncbi:hypothetical protein B0H16DRAFT_1860643, partial [Mycena metata]